RLKSILASVEQELKHHKSALRVLHSKGLVMPDVGLSNVTGDNDTKIVYPVEQTPKESSSIWLDILKVVGFLAGIIVLLTAIFNCINSYLKMNKKDSSPKVIRIQLVEADDSYKK